MKNNSFHSNCDKQSTLRVHACVYGFCCFVHYHSSQVHVMDAPLWWRAMTYSFYSLVAPCFGSLPWPRSTSGRVCRRSSKPKGTFTSRASKTACVWYIMAWCLSSQTHELERSLRSSFIFWLVRKSLIRGRSLFPSWSSVQVTASQRAALQVYPLQLSHVQNPLR